MLIKSSLIVALASLAAGRKTCHGPRGDQGFDGPTGIEGEQGLKGDKGAIGPIGEIGQGNVIYCAGPIYSDVDIPENVAVPFGSCVQTKGFLPIESFGYTRMVQVQEPGVYQITFYAFSSSTYRVYINGIAMDEVSGGLFDGAGSVYTQGQFVYNLSAGSIISIKADVYSTIFYSQFESVGASLLIQRVAQVPV